MDLNKVVVLVIGFVVFSELCLLGSANVVFHVQHKFGGTKRSLSEFKVHDSDRHRRFLSAVDLPIGGDGSPTSAAANHETETRPFKRSKKTRVTFRDQVGGELVEVVGVSDGADVETEPGPMGVKEGSSLVGKYESLVQTTVIPKGKEISSSVKEVTAGGGVTDKLQQVLNKVKAPPPSSKGGIYDDLYGGVGLGSSSWAYSGGPMAESKVSGAVTVR